MGFQKFRNIIFHSKLFVMKGIHVQYMQLDRFSNLHHFFSSRGLYLGYLKARVSSSVASMTIVTSGALPNVLPHYRIRENPNISQSEWEWLRSMHKKTEVCMCVCVCVCVCVRYSVS